MKQFIFLETSVQHALMTEFHEAKVTLFTSGVQAVKLSQKFL